MANGGNRTIAPVRKLIAAVLGTVATFVVLFGLGMTSWAIVALGVALVVLAVALGTVRGGGRTWVVGVGHVHSASEPPTQYAFGRCELQLVIDAPGMPPRSKKIIEPRVPVAKWPSLGQTLPIRVALDDQRHVRVLWDEVPTHTESTMTMADLPPEYAGAEPLDDLLIQQEAPPWAGRTADDDFRDEFRDDLRDPPSVGPLPDDASPDDPPRSTSPHQEPARTEPLRDDVEVLTDEREPVVVHQRPGRPVVLEGTVVEQSTTGPLPRRATATAAPAPRPPAEERFDEPILDPVDVPLDAPAATEGRLDPELDEAIFGYDPTAAPAEPEELAAPISGVGLTLLVTDLSRSLEFYRDVLGFEEFDRGSGNAVLASGATRLVLREVTGAAPMSRRLVHVNLEVDDIEAAYRRLKDSGLRFTYAPRVVNRGSRVEVWAAAFRDPDGHGIALTQWRERADA
ncbi:VOC family protein [Micromonospora antibiotica]|uniref:VOC family protein n=1 Tax=Micromonospora antibiotica TaxID=2807623 RepID=A0ABS3VIH1_9ACTN|nr:VOC family protein [Micromonospora antibiotica]MBO4165448.1 VOC family protein [Micromonospora antibiotica]